MNPETLPRRGVGRPRRTRAVKHIGFSIDLELWTALDRLCHAERVSKMQAVIAGIVDMIMAGKIPTTRYEPEQLETFDETEDPREQIKAMTEVMWRLQKEVAELKKTRQLSEDGPREIVGPARKRPQTPVASTQAPVSTRAE